MAEKTFNDARLEFIKENNNSDINTKKRVNFLVTKDFKLLRKDDKINISEFSAKVYEKLGIGKIK